MAGLSQEDMAKFIAYAQQLHQEEAEKETKSTKINEAPEQPAKASPIRRNHEEGDELDLKNDFLITERMYLLMSKSKFYEAVSLFGDLAAVDENDVGIKLLIAECYIQLGRETKAEKAIKDVEKILMRPEMCNIDDVMDLSDAFIGCKSPVRALLLLRIASDMFRKSSLPPDDKVGGIFRCIRKMVEPIIGMLNPEEVSAENTKGMLQDLLRALTAGGDPNPSVSPTPESKPGTKKSERTRVIALDYGLEPMEKMLVNLGKVRDAEPENLALKEVIVSNFIGRQYSTAGHRVKAVNAMKKGLKKYEDYFGDRSNQHQAYVTILANIGAELHNSEKYKESEVYKIKSIEAVDYVLDFNSEEDRRRESARLRESLKITRNHMSLA